jgi:hypothetical protein
MPETEGRFDLSAAHAAPPTGTWFPPSPAAVRRLVARLRAKVAAEHPPAFAAAARLAIALGAAFDRATRHATDCPAFLARMQQRAFGELATRTGDPCDAFRYLLDGSNALADAVLTARPACLSGLAALARVLAWDLACGWRPQQDEAAEHLARALARLAGDPVRGDGA